MGEIALPARRASPSQKGKSAPFDLWALKRAVIAYYPEGMETEDRITIVAGVRSGKPCIRGTRIAVYDVLEYLAGGMTEAQILAEFPRLRQEDIRACLAFAAARERRLAGQEAA